MPKYYVESGQIRLVLVAGSAERAAIRAFEWSLDRQTEIYAHAAPGLIREAEATDFLLGDEIRVSERGFDGEAEFHDTLDIASRWQSEAFCSRTRATDPAQARAITADPCRVDA